VYRSLPVSMGIHADWMRIFKEVIDCHHQYMFFFVGIRTRSFFLLGQECPEAFTPTPPLRPAAAFIDGQIQLMKPNGVLSWDQFVQYQFATPVRRMLVRTAACVCVCVCAVVTAWGRMSSGSAGRKQWCWRSTTTRTCLWRSR
jgi:hypothetical protein